MSAPRVDVHPRARVDVRVDVRIDVRIDACIAPRIDAHAVSGGHLRPGQRISPSTLAQRKE